MLARSALWYVVFAGFAINYMHRIHINIIIVGMVKLRATGNISSTSSECIDHSNPTIQNIATNSSVQILRPEGFNWDERQQNYVLGSFFWLHWITQIPGGVLARRFGTKKIFGFANFISGLLTFTLPMASHINIWLLVFIRVVQGFITGAAWPSMHHLTAHWIPPNERGKFVSSYLGSSFGVAFTYPLCGYVMHLFGWEAAFYTTGVLATIWFICWWVLVYDTPDQHPWISQKEKAYIQCSLDKSVNDKKMSIPWKEILTSRPLWMVSIAQFGGIWGFYTLMTQGPTYFKTILGLNIRMTGLISGVPHLTRWLWAVFSGIIADYLLNNKLLSRTNVRKLATSSCTLLQGLMVLGLAYSGCNTLAAIIFLIAAVGANGSVSSGPLACVVDMSPNFASISLGLAGLVANIPGFISPLVVGYLTYQNQTAEQWQKVFLITTALLTFVGVLYLIFGTADLQPWNSSPDSSPEQMQILNPDKTDVELKNVSSIKSPDVKVGLNLSS